MGSEWTSVPGYVVTHTLRSEGGRDRAREGGTERGREGWREGQSEGGREGGREGGVQGYLHVYIFCGIGEKNRGYYLLMTANKPETAQHRAPTFSLLASHGGLMSICVDLAGSKIAITSAKIAG